MVDAIKSSEITPSDSNSNTMFGGLGDDQMYGLDGDDSLLGTMGMTSLSEAKETTRLMVILVRIESAVPQVMMLFITPMKVPSLMVVEIS